MNIIADEEWREACPLEELWSGDLAGIEIDDVCVLLVNLKSQGVEHKSCDPSSPPVPGAGFEPA